MTTIERDKVNKYSNFWRKLPFGVAWFHWYGTYFNLCFGATGVYSVGHRTDLESVWSALHWCCSRLEIDFFRIHYYNFTMGPWKHPNKQVSEMYVCVCAMHLAGSLLLHLLDWVRLHKADVDEKAREVLQSESPAEHYDYWNVVGTTRILYCNKDVCAPSCELEHRCSLIKPPHSLIRFTSDSECSVNSQVSHVLCLGSAGGELCAAGQVGGSQTDAGEAGYPAACCQEHVQADGHSALKDALLQCKKMIPYSWYSELVHTRFDLSCKYHYFICINAKHYTWLICIGLFQASFEKGWEHFIERNIVLFLYSILPKLLLNICQKMSVLVWHTMN